MVSPGVSSSCWNDMSLSNAGISVCVAVVSGRMSGDTDANYEDNPGRKKAPRRARRRHRSMPAPDTSGPELPP